MEQTSNEDLKAFERRLTEVINGLQPQATRWRIFLLVSAVFTALGAFWWLTDPLTGQVTFVQSLLNHLFFTFNVIVLTILFFMGIHNRVVAPAVMVSRVRNTLADFNMSCDDNGRLILKPRPTTNPIS